MKACVYILQSDDGHYYVGVTSNIEKRLKQHLSGQSRYTKRFKGLKLVLMQEYDSLIAAGKIENKIKSLKRKDYIKRMNG